MSKSFSVNLSTFYNLKKFKVSDNSLSNAYDLNNTRVSLNNKNNTTITKI